MSGVQARALQRIRTVFVKEVRDHWRDRRSIVLSLMFPLMAPILVGLLLSNIAGTNVDGTSKRDIRIAVAGEKFAPGLIAYLRENGVAMHQAPLGREAQETALSTRAERVILEVPPEAAGREKFSLTVMVDRNNPGGVADAAELMRHITAFGRATSERLVVAAGLDQTDVTPITVEEVTVGRAPNTAFLFYNLMAPLIMFMIFMGAVYLAIDVTVGERERGSLEPLLTAPVARHELLLGKSLAALCFTALIVGINLAAFRTSLVLATGGATGLAPPPGIASFAAMFLVSVPLMALAVTVQMSIAAVTRSAKEAQIYLGLLPIVPLIPGMAMVFAPVPPSLATALIPVFGQLTLFGELIRGEGVPLGPALVASAVTLLVAVLVFTAAARLFGRERVVFGQ